MSDDRLLVGRILNFDRGYGTIESLAVEKRENGRWAVFNYHAEEKAPGDARTQMVRFAIGNLVEYRQEQNGPGTFHVTWLRVLPADRQQKGN